MTILQHLHEFFTRARRTKLELIRHERAVKRLYRGIRWCESEKLCIKLNKEPMSEWVKIHNLQWQLEMRLTLM